MPVPTQSAIPSARPASRAAVDDTPRIRKRPNYPFLLRISGASWEVVTEGLDEPTWVPVIRQHILRPGAGGVRTISENEDARRAYEDAKMRAEQQGWVYLDPYEVLAPEHRPEGSPESGYLVEYDCRDPKTKVAGIHYVEAWSTPVAGAPNGTQQFGFDRAAYNRWRAHLVASGVVTPPPDMIKQDVQRRYQQHVNRAEVLNLPDGVRERRVAKAEAIAESVEKGVVPKPKRSRKGAK